MLKERIEQELAILREGGQEAILITDASRPLVLYRNVPTGRYGDVEVFSTRSAKITSSAIAVAAKTSTTRIGTSDQERCGLGLAGVTDEAAGSVATGIGPVCSASGCVSAAESPSVTVSVARATVCNRGGDAV